MPKKLTKKITVKGLTKTKKPKKKKKMYFGKEAHQAIVDYQNAETQKEKNDIYTIRIKPSFEKLSENLIFIHGFAGKDYSMVDILKYDCVSFLYETLEKFDPSKGSKAFSYFNVVAKNWLIIQSKKRVKKEMRHVSLSEYSTLSKRDKKSISHHMIIPSQEKIMIMRQNKEMIKTLLKEIRVRLTNQNEIACTDAIITLFNKIDELDFLNKRAVFVYLRELSKLTPKQLSVAMSNIRKHYRELVKNDDDLNFFIL
jgi:hypothetical protein|tara:strand:- start:96 stop:860 length:765 start_codon:yes stop_codon:yes gene_type:complete